MKAYKCDRCGKFFAHASRDADKIYITDSYKSDAQAGIIDLCVKCQMELEEWWMKGKDKEVADDNKRT